MSRRKRHRHLTDADVVEAMRLAEEHGLDELRLMVDAWLRMTSHLTLLVGAFMGSSLAIVAGSGQHTKVFGYENWQPYAMLGVLFTVMVTYFFLCERLREGLRLTLACHLHKDYRDRQPPP